MVGSNFFVEKNKSYASQCIDRKESYVQAQERATPEITT
jgi:hypothetical protein